MLRADKPISPIEFWFYRHYRAVHGVTIAFVLCFLFVRLTDIPEGTAADHAGGGDGTDLHRAMFCRAWCSVSAVPLPG